VSESGLYRGVLFGWFAMSAITFLVLLGRTAPYGRHARGGWGPVLPPRLAWLLMEAPAAIVIATFAVPSLVRDEDAQGWLLLVLWELHYLQRGFVYPFRIRSTRAVPVSVVAMAVFFNGMNGWLNARGLTTYGPELGRVSLTHPRVLSGAALFLVGLAVNWSADARLLSLPRGADGSYSIPRGGMYELVSCPNYLGELIEWAGFALAAGSLAAISFFVWTAANLVPRALAHHRWYREHFVEYPTRRRALVPFVF
jgi:hypothetical protein